MKNLENLCLKGKYVSYPLFFLLPLFFSKKLEVFESPNSRDKKVNSDSSQPEVLAA